MGSIAYRILSKNNKVLYCENPLIITNEILINNYQKFHYAVILSYNLSNQISHNIKIKGELNHINIHNYRKMNNIAFQITNGYIIYESNDYVLCYCYKYNDSKFIINDNIIKMDGNLILYLGKVFRYGLLGDNIIFSKMSHVPINESSIIYEKKETKYSLIVVIAFTQRYDIMRKNLNSLKNCHIILVGSDCDLEFCKSQNTSYVICNNDYLGLKWQIGVYFARLFNPTGIIILGSDDILSNNYLKTINELSIKYDMIGVRHWYIEYQKRTYYVEYTDKVKITLGSGRYYSRQILDKIQWELFEIFLNKGLDDYGYYQVINHQGKNIDDDKNLSITSIKGEWDMINDFQKFCEFENLGYITMKLI